MSRNDLQELSRDVECRCCGCSEGDPCRLETNEACVLNVVTKFCSNSKCVLAHGQLVRRTEAARRADLAGRVRPITQKFLEDVRRRREARRSKARNRARKQRRAA